MSAKTFSRAASGVARANLKQLGRMRAPLALQLPPPASLDQVDWRWHAVDRIGDDLRAVPATD